MKKVTLLIVATALSMVMNMTVFAGEWKQDGYRWWYQSDNNEYLKNSWLQDNGKWYHFDNNGYMQTGWLELSSKWYYLNSNGEMQTTPITLEDGVKYIFNEDGSCINPWQGFEDEYRYDITTGTWKNVAVEMAERDIINEITSQPLF